VKTLFLNQFLGESRNKIIWKLYEEETIFISAFNAENSFVELALVLNIAEILLSRR
jgi:hypothetical protein